MWHVRYSLRIKKNKFQTKDSRVEIWRASRRAWLMAWFLRRISRSFENNGGRNLQRTGANVTWAGFNRFSEYNTISHKIERQLTVSTLYTMILKMQCKLSLKLSLKDPVVNYAFKHGPCHMALYKISFQGLGLTELSLTFTELFLDPSWDFWDPQCVSFSIIYRR